MEKEASQRSSTLGMSITVTASPSKSLTVIMSSVTKWSILYVPPNPSYLSLSLFISFLSLFPIQLSITSFYLYTYILDTMYTLSFYIYIDEKYLLMPEFELVIETCYDLVYIIRGNNFWILKIIHKV